MTDPAAEPLSDAELLTLRQWLDADRFATYTSQPENVVRRLLATLDRERDLGGAERLLDGIRDEVRDAVVEGDAQDCSSPDCIADAVYEIVRVRLRAAATPPEPAGLDVDVLYQAVMDELAELWGDPIDFVSGHVRPIVARSIAARYAALRADGAER